MSAITPNTNLRLIKCPIESDNRNQITFSNVTAQKTYFKSLPHLEVDNFTYQRKDSVIRYPANIDSIMTYNYVMYQNEEYSDKYFYAFITGMEYVNDNMTYITIKTDVYQTWLFDMVWKRSFVEREHVNNDTIGLHTVPENLETGEYISTDLQPSTKGDYTTCFCVSVSEFLFNSYSTLNEAIPCGLYYIGLTTLQGVRDVIKVYDDAGKGDAIVSVFVIPKTLFSNWGNSTGIDGQISTTVKFSTGASSLAITRPSYLGESYTPKNNKLFCYPYSFLQVTNHNGTIVNYYWEEFNRLVSDTDCKFSLKGALTPGGSFFAYPVDYKNILDNVDEGIPLGKFPIGGWNTDVYTNWLTQNSVNIALGTISSTLQIANGNVGAGLSGIASQVAQVYQHSLIPDQARGNTNVGDYSFAFGLTNFEFKRISVKNEYAEIIDNYFSMYGYKINLVKLPNLTGRTNWNYVKTINANIEGDIPEDDMNEIKSLFNNGITLWHKTSYYLDYSQSNNIA